MPSAQAKKPKLRIVRPCPSMPQSVPVRDECVAAAMRKRALLEHTNHTLRDHVILAKNQGGPLWEFLVEADPPAPGSHWIVSVNRATGAIKIIDGL
jgi:hypothetical protein